MTSTRRTPLTVSEMLELEFLQPLSMSVRELAAKAGLDLGTAERVVAGTLRVDPPLADALSRALGNSPDFWLRTQRRSDEHRPG